MRGDHHRAVDHVGPVDHQRRQPRKQNPATALTSHDLESTTPSRPESPPAIRCCPRSAAVVVDYVTAAAAEKRVYGTVAYRLATLTNHRRQLRKQNPSTARR